MIVKVIIKSALIIMHHYHQYHNHWPNHPHLGKIFKTSMIFVRNKKKKSQKMITKYHKKMDLVYIMIQVIIQSQ